MNLSKEADWKDSLSNIVPAYNYTWKEATGFSTYYLLFGHTPRLSVDVLFNLPSQDQQASYEKYVTKWHSQMKEAYEIAPITAQKEAWQSQREKSREALVILGGCSVCGSESKSPSIPVYEFKPQKEERVTQYTGTCSINVPACPWKNHTDGNKTNKEKPETKGRRSSTTY